ncbi:MAG: hypothetical protein WBV56_11325 [Azonexus sp.]
MWWISYRGEGRHGLENIGVFNDDGNVIDGVVITFIDISVAKKLEAELRAAKGAGL